MTQSLDRIAIVGAGLSGLACARRLCRAGGKVQLFDKARGPGGRMSTRRVETPLGTVGFDHGAQYFTARGDSFRAEVARWVSEGLAATWPAAGPEAWVGLPGMNAPVKALAEGHSVAWNTVVEALIRDAEGWRLKTPEGLSGPFDAVVLALPAEQAAALLAPHDEALTARAAASRTAPCWTVMAAFAERLPVASDTLEEDGILGWAARNSAKPGRGGPEAWVLQASPDWSREHLEDPADTVGDALFAAFATRLSAPLPEPVIRQVHRWRYARSATGSEQALWSETARLGCCGDWLAGPRVECAWDSGEALARLIINARGE
ncbi:MAG: FAD-dependent oxidoreductase [Phenylobacterium sp.]|jgi:predicted NAD/FAD-dependent oxidoreductase|uniref:NAD(P)/FAD-dependent oxidoreductase n=1 Tax=Phenylobacterium sp. TaxID=1871053 RepID=UPI0025E6B4B6|nr:FAD-dependent oxidoreductase [Phenylobacterium sp.]MCA3710663.1 FAD-dependent oxidoreductase [Phenylobacterium sp.]MCA3738381.1 FAD-dependent oxidoreductase [Phenylobacterium sp.]MCA3757201.1 FAD-dependent oxidoreductase [Phenylobacterium sp.]